LDIKTLEDAIIAAIGTQFSELKTVQRADSVDGSAVSLPAVFIQTDSVQESPYATEEETHYTLSVKALVIYRNSEKSAMMENLAGYIDFINRNTWGDIVFPAEFTGSERVPPEPETKDLYIWEINFSHYIKP